jgi:hypothetical protein
MRSNWRRRSLRRYQPGRRTRAPDGVCRFNTPASITFYAKHGRATGRAPSVVLRRRRQRRSRWRFRGCGQKKSPAPGGRARHALLEGSCGLLRLSGCRRRRRRRVRRGRRSCRGSSSGATRRHRITAAITGKAEDEEGEDAEDRQAANNGTHAPGTVVAADIIGRPTPAVRVTLIGHLVLSPDVYFWKATSAEQLSSYRGFVAAGVLS